MKKVLAFLLLISVMIGGCSSASPCNDALVERVKATGNLVQFSDKLVQTSAAGKSLKNLKWVASDRGNDACTVTQWADVNGETLAGVVFYIDLGNQRIYADNNFARNVIGYGDVPEAGGGGVPLAK